MDINIDYFYAIWLLFYINYKIQRSLCNVRSISVQYKKVPRTVRVRVIPSAVWSVRIIIKYLLQLKFPIIGSDNQLLAHKYNVNL